MAVLGHHKPETAHEKPLAPWVTSGPLTIAPSAPETFHSRFPVSSLQSDPREGRFFSRGFAARVFTKLVLVEQREENLWYPGSESDIGKTWIKRLHQGGFINL